MQKERTLQFWDDYYKTHQDEQSKEWILKPSTLLLQKLAHHVPRKQNCRILEIGCGTSSLARDLFRYLLDTEPRAPNNSTNDQLVWQETLQVIATDVSSTCIKKCQERDANISDERLRYQTLNVVETCPELRGQFDVILDKGCLDTFLFRSRQRGGGRQPYGVLLSTVLNNLQSWLCQPSGQYLVLTPRSKLKSARDYVGFASVERQPLDVSRLDLGDLEGTDPQDEPSLQPEPLFLYICKPCLEYDPSRGESFPRDHPVPHDVDTCSVCSMSFAAYRRGERLSGRGDAYWSRQWRGHCLHCKG
jgi:SAM-dependent methyltransferase